jgi:hypothetical protein
MKRRALTMSQSETNHFLSFIVAVKFDSAFIHIIIVIPFSEKFLPLFYKHSQLFSCKGQYRNIYPWDYPSLTGFIVRLLSLL